MSSGNQEEENEGRAVLDSSAVLAWLLSEKGSDVVESSLPGLISAVNLSEVIYVAVQRGLSPDAVRDALHELPLVVVPFDADQAYHTAVIHSSTRALGFSLGDCACLALASSRGLSALTGDKDWSKAKLDVTVRQIR